MGSREFGSEINQDNLSNVAAGEEATVAPAPTRVAHLRSFLDDFGRKNKAHFEKSLATSANADVQKSPVRRPKIRRSVESGPTPLPDEAASVLVRRILKPTTHTSVSSSSKFKKIVPETNKQVEATDEGYASVEQLCKWLADDPTSTKKVRQLRRGSNVLTKSRAFDKGLANAIVVEHKIQHGRVSTQRKQFERRDTIGAPAATTVRNHWSAAKKSSAASEIVTRKDERLAKAEVAKQQWRDRIQPPAVKQVQEKPVTKEKESKDSVVDENEWNGGEEDGRSEVGSSVTEVAKPATTVRNHWSVAKKSSAASEIVTRKDERLAKAEVAKQQWRDRIQPPAVKQEQEKPVTKEKESKDSVVDENEWNGGEEDGRSEVGSSVTEVAKPHANTSTLLDRLITEHDNADEPSMFLDTPSECSQATVEASLPPSASSESMDFRQARELVVKRSESNGSAEQERVQLRKTKFEKLQKDMRRKTGTHGLLKASWDVEEGNYVKKYVSDIPPKRSLHELP